MRGLTDAEVEAVKSWVIFEDGALLAGDAVRGWDRADEVEVARYSAAEPWNA